MNSKIKIGAYGSPFSHDFSSCHNNLPKKFQWDFNTQNDIEVYMDFDITGGFNSQSKYKFLWLCESKELFNNSYDFIKNNLNIFKNSYKKIFTHCNELLDVDDIFEYCPAGSNKSWIVEGKINKKTKLVSMICSGTQITKGHKFRNDIMKVLKQNNTPVDFYGRSHNPFSKKEEALSDYCFSFVIENGSYSHYYTEKIMDCFATGTIPIYYGAPDINTIFNKDGIIILDDNFDINKLSPEYYWSKMDAIKENYELCLNHKIADDCLFEQIEREIHNDTYNL